ncbi:DUF3368 domain-containing protein [Brevibacillus sp. 179-C9.3 HS]|uniref:DUF3368 domain-containing protein n=1 Tax=unclassified Brevibacillus TaxID=2684853 RepID=UPI0039A09461
MTKLISNTSPLIALSMIGQLHLLWELFDRVFIPQAVFTEICSPEDEFAFGKMEVMEAIREKRIELYEVRDELFVERMYGKLHHGELETIVGGMELQVDFVLIDERAARNMAKSFFLIPMGSIGILRLAKRVGKIEAVKPYLDLLVEKEYRISKRMYDEVLRLEGEN